MKWLDRLPLRWLLPIALWLAVAPVLPEPHLLEKWRWLVHGQLSRPLDQFDLLLHTLPLVLLALKLWRLATGPQPSATPPAPPKA